MKKKKEMGENERKNRQKTRRRKREEKVIGVRRVEEVDPSLESSSI